MGLFGVQLKINCTSNYLKRKICPSPEGEDKFSFK